MQVTWLKRGTSHRLRVVVLGWAADPSMVHPVDESDLVCIYDYRTIEPLKLDNYTEIHLIAWSYGVWAAEQIFDGQSFTTATAINGTPYPTDEQYGIPARIFAMTVASINIAKFVQRMSIGLPITPTLQRDEAECIDELRALAQHFTQRYTPKICWTQAVICLKDMIFPPQAQQNYWVQVPIILEPSMPHLPTGYF